MSFHPIKHLIVITRHRHKVIAHCAKAGILHRGLLHDLSKYSPSEFIAGAKYFDGTVSPNNIQRKIYGYSAAWLHHKGRNRHHFEYWYDVVTHDGITEPMPIRMPMEYAKELFCDRVAASKIYRGSSYTQDYPLEYYYKEKAGKYMHPETAALVEGWLKMLASRGEQETFLHIRNIKDYDTE